MSELPDFDPGFSTARMREIWRAASRVRRFLDVEAALAHATAEAGLIPAAAVTAIEAACAHVAAPESILAEGWRAGTPVLVLLDRVRAAMPAEHAPHLHFGATTQDIADTATVLQLREAFDELSRSLMAISDALVAAIELHPSAWVTGRTLLQPALPMKLSFRLACWLEPLLDVAEQIGRMRSALPLQLGGPVGDLSSFRGDGERVTRALATRLGLAVPVLPWHADRGPMVSSIVLAVRAASAAEKIAADLLILSQSEIAEVALPSGDSSSMPHKKNAIGAVRAAAAARACRSVANIVTGAPAHELERAAGSWHAEWFAVPLVFHTAGAVLEAVHGSVAGAVFDEERGTHNLRGVVPATAPDAERLVERVVERHRELRASRS